MFTRRMHEEGVRKKARDALGTKAKRLATLVWMQDFFLPAISLMQFVGLRFLQCRVRKKLANVRP